MKNLIFSTYLILSCTLSFSQNLILNYTDCGGCPQNMNTNDSINHPLYNYGINQAWQTGHIESDFDLRRATGNSRWHKGLDLRNHGAGADMQRGDAIVSPETGTIVNLEGENYKYIIIDGANYDFGYGHIFSHNEVSSTVSWRSGNFVLTLDEGNQNGINEQPAIVNLNTCIAYSTINGRNVILPSNHCQDTLVTTNTVLVGAEIAPIGGSRTNNTLDFPVHLHLYKFRNPNMAISNANCMDPLVDILHPNTPHDIYVTFNQNIESDTFSNWSQVNLNYPGTNFNTISVRSRMHGAIAGIDSSRYTNVVQNLDSLSILISYMDINSPEPIYVPNWRSEFLMAAKRNTTLYPSNLHDHYGNQNTTGISPYAYRDNTLFKPYDNFYFADFVTMLHKNDPLDGTSTPTSYA